MPLPMPALMRGPTLDRHLAGRVTDRIDRAVSDAVKAAVAQIGAADQHHDDDQRAAVDAAVQRAEDAAAEAMKIWAAVGVRAEVAERAAAESADRVSDIVRQSAGVAAERAERAATRAEDAAHNAAAARDVAAEHARSEEKG